MSLAKIFSRRVLAQYGSVSSGKPSMGLHRRLFRAPRGPLVGAGQRTPSLRQGFRGPPVLVSGCGAVEQWPGLWPVSTQTRWKVPTIWAEAMLEWHVLEPRPLLAGLHQLYRLALVTRRKKHVFGLLSAVGRMVAVVPRDGHGMSVHRWPGLMAIAATWPRHGRARL